MASKELEQALAWQRELLERTAGQPDIAAARAARAEMMRRRSGKALPSDIIVEAVEIAGVAAEWVTPPTHNDGRIILYAHGGGWTLGAPEDVRELLARIARRSQSRGLALDYRLAPEHPYPAAIDDVLRVYRRLLRDGADHRQIAFAGESTGGNITLCAALALRDAGDPLPGALVLLSPLSDMTLGGESMTTNADRDPLNQRAALATFMSLYLAGMRRADPRVSPLMAVLAGLPPMIIQVGTAEALLDDSRRLAANARAAGVEVTYDEYPEMIHLWHGFPYLLDGLRATRRLGDTILQRIGPAAVASDWGV